MMIIERAKGIAEIRFKRLMRSRRLQQHMSNLVKDFSRILDALYLKSDISTFEKSFENVATLFKIDFNTISNIRYYVMYHLSNFCYFYWKWKFTSKKYTKKLDSVITNDCNLLSKVVSELSYQKLQEVVETRGNWNLLYFTGVVYDVISSVENSHCELKLIPDEVHIDFEKEMSKYVTLLRDLLIYELDLEVNRVASKIYNPSIHRDEDEVRKMIRENNIVKSFYSFTDKLFTEFLHNKVKENFLDECGFKYFLTQRILKQIPSYLLEQSLKFDLKLTN